MTPSALGSPSASSESRRFLAATRLIGLAKRRLGSARAWGVKAECDFAEPHIVLGIMFCQLEVRRGGKSCLSASPLVSACLIATASGREDAKHETQFPRTHRCHLAPILSTRLRKLPLRQPPGVGQDRADPFKMGPIASTIRFPAAEALLAGLFLIAPSFRMRASNSDPPRFG